MRMSCNGCRVLRKGCSDNCSIRPCLQWIKSAESQANATVFLAKFYGRAGLMNLINSGPEHHRPVIFRSLLYEACGRIVNPIYGSVGLLWSGSWQLCQTAVEAVLNGTPVVQISSDDAASSALPPFKAYDIRHVSKDQPDQEPVGASRTSAELHKVNKATRTRFKRSVAKPLPPDVVEAEMCGVNWHESLGEAAPREGDSRENESMYSVDTMETSHVSQGEPGNDPTRAEDELELELTLGLNPSSRGE